MSFNIKVSGVWKTTSEVYANVSGTWKRLGEIYVKVAGVWKPIFYASGSSTYSTPGTYTFTVPAGVYQVTLAVTGGGGGGQAYYFDGGSGHVSNGATGTNSSVSGTGVSLTANAGGGGGTGAGGGTVYISGSGLVSTTTNSTGGTHSGTTGGSSYYGAGSSGGGDFSKPATPSAQGAGGGAGFYQNIATVGGDGGGTGIAVYNVLPFQTLSVTVGSGGAGPSINYAQGSNHGSYAGDGANGYVSISY